MKTFYEAFYDSMIESEEEGQGDEADRAYDLFSELDEEKKHESDQN
jgi:hypothetical protein